MPVYVMALARANKKAVASMLGIALLVGCVGDPIVSVPTNGVVMTFNDGSVDFGALTTFAMPDTIVHISPSGSPLAISRQYDSLALTRVRQDLLARGYTEIGDSVKVPPSFIVLVGATATTNYQPWMPCQWYSTWGFYSGWDWYPPGFTSDWLMLFPWSVVFGSMVVDRGTIVVTLVPTSSVNQISRSVKSAWAGLATAALDEVPVTSDGVRSAIDEMFRQSPFLVADVSGGRHGGAGSAARASSPY